jgi:hypothetical protein
VCARARVQLPRVTIVWLQRRGSHRAFAFASDVGDKTFAVSQRYHTRRGFEEALRVFGKYFPYVAEEISAPG